MSELAPVGAPAPFDWQKFLETLSPSARVTVEDITGGKHSCRPVLPARREVELIGKLAEVTDLKIDGAAELLASLRAKPDVATMLGLLRKLMKSPAVLTIISEAFGIAYPAAVTAALANVRGDDELKGDLPANPTPADLFPASELLGGLLPFAARTVSGIRDKVTSLQNPPAPKT